jgi:Helix-turn-helix domain
MSCCRRGRVSECENLGSLVTGHGVAPADEGSQMTKAEQLRLVTFRSKFLEHAKRNGNVSATCRYFGISREKFYKWKKRFEQLGAAGLAEGHDVGHDAVLQPRSID